MNLTEQQKSTAAIYKQLIESAVWKDLERIAEEQRLKSISGLDSTPIMNMSIGSVCEERGFRNGIKWILDQARIKAEIG